MYLYLFLASVITTIYIKYLINLEKPIIKEIQESNEIDYAILKRKELNMVRNKSMFNFIILWGIILFFLLLFDQKGDIILAWLFVLFFSYYLICKRHDHNPLAKLYYFSKKDIINSKFILFLRGFEDDNYTPKYYLSKFTFRYGNFSEFHFMSILSKYIKTYAAGMTKEIETPAGAARVHLDDDSWEDDVLDLMKHSAFNIILMNDRPSCIWEIEKSANLLTKTLFIIEDHNKYLHITKVLNHKIEFPAIPEGHSFPIALFYDSNLNPITYDFSNDNYSYKRLISTLLVNYLGYNRTENSRWKSFLRSSFFLFFSFILTIITCGVEFNLFVPLFFFVLVNVLWIQWIEYQDPIRDIKTF